MVVPEILPDAAVIVVVPCVCVVASPEVSIVATVELDDAQLTDDVMSFEELSE